MLLLHGGRYRQPDRSCQVALASSTARQAHEVGLGSSSADDYTPSRFTQLLQVLLPICATSISDRMFVTFFAPASAQVTHICACIHILQRFQARLLQCLPLLSSHWFRVHPRTISIIGLVLAPEGNSCQSLQPACYHQTLCQSWSGCVFSSRCSHTRAVQSVATAAVLRSCSTVTFEVSFACGQSLNVAW